MSSISLAMIVKNEELVLERCLKSFYKLVDEIIIVDTGSDDNTKTIAKRYTDKIYDFKWTNDFSKARNFGFLKCKMDYIMWVDADDVFEQNDETNFFKLKKQLKKYDVAMLQYNIAFDNNNQPIFSYYRERILKNDKSFVWQDPVHEVITPHGKILYSQIAINHKPINKHKQCDRNLKIYKTMLSEGIKLNNRQKYYYSRELMDNQEYELAIKNFEEYLHSEDLWKENTISACKDLAFCYLKTNKTKMAKEVLFKSFVYDLPRAEICCSIANIFLSENNFHTAIFWYKQALLCKPNIKSGAFVQQEFYGVIPYLQLCFCYYKLGDIKASKKYNAMAGKINPQNESFLYNKKFFENNKY